MNGKISRRALGLGLAVVIVGIIVLAFWPSPAVVDFGAVERGPLIVTVNEEARTRVRDVYVVSAPVSGRLLRIDSEPGDLVEGQLTVVARMLPSDPSFLDARAQTQAEADVRSAEAGLTLAQAEVERAQAQTDYAETEVGRARELFSRETVSQAVVDRAELQLRTARAALSTAQATVRVRQAALENARARLMDPTAVDADANADGVIEIRAPVSGRVLRVLHESEGVVLAGAPLLEVGDPESDLEIVTELLSTDAVRVQPGDRVIIDKWGGPHTLDGAVERVEPFGFTKISALGVEEQRVNVVIQFENDAHDHAELGHGFRVETRIVVWEDADALRAPSSALFRQGEDWALFRETGGRAALTTVQVGENNGAHAQIVSGVEAGARVVLYPSDQVADGGRVKARPAE